MQELLQQTVHGLPIGSEYVLVALGLTLMFGVLGIPNIAHGGVYMVGAFTGYGLTVGLDAPYVAGLIGGLLAGMALGVIVYRSAFKPLSHANSLTLLVAALATLIIVTQGATVAFGGESHASRPAVAGALTVGSVRIPFFTLILVATAITAAGLLAALIRHSKFGRGMRAVAENPAASLLMGISHARIGYGTFAIGSALGGLAGALVGTTLPISPDMGLEPVLKAFVVIIVGGVGSIVGAVVAGLGLGIAEALAAGYVGGEYRDIVAFVILVAVLIIRPEGLIQRRSALRGRAVAG